MFVGISITIPSNLKHIVKEMIVEEKTLDINLGKKYAYQKIKETINQHFIKFKKNIEKRLKDENIEEADTNKIISLIEDKHNVIYSSDKDEESEKNEIDVYEEYDDNPANAYHDLFGESYPQLETQISDIDKVQNIIEINHKSPSSSIDNQIINIQELQLKIKDSDPLDYIQKIIKKTVKCDDILIKQILYTGLSTYSQSDPINLGIIAPTSEGKTYPVEECIKLFPKQDVYKIGSMSTKVLIRQKGIILDKDNKPLKPILKELQRKMNTLKKEQKEEKTTIEEQIKELTEDSKTLIDLNGKILVFLEPPQKELWNVLKPILSHDSSEIEFPYVDRNDKNGIHTKKVVVRGWPACIFCSAKDESKWEMWPEIKSRFLITSPNMIPEKYKESVNLIAQIKGLPMLIQKQIILSDEEIELAKECILYLKQRISELNSSVWIPFAKSLERELPSNKGTDVRFAKRIFSLLILLAILRSDKRKTLIIENEQSVIVEVDDLKEALEITQNFDGIPKYKKDFYNEIFYPCYILKTEPDNNKDNSKGESIIAVTTKQLCEYYKKIKNKIISSDNMKKTYLDELQNSGLIDSEPSAINQRQFIYYPLLESTSTDNAVNNDDEDKKASFPSNLNNFDHLSYSNFRIYEKITKNMNEEQLFYELMQLLSHRINFDKIKGPLADYLNSNKDFQIIDNNNNNNKTGTCDIDAETKFLSYIKNKANKKEHNYNNLSNDEHSNDNEKCCCININKDNSSSNRLTIRQFTKNYINFQENKFDGNMRSFQPSFSETNRFSLNSFKVDKKDMNEKNSGENGLMLTRIKEDESKILDNHRSDVISNSNNTESLKSDLSLCSNNQQDIKPDSTHTDLFECYYCDKFSATTNKKDYEKHVVLNHDNKLAYPTLADLIKMQIPSKGKEWET